MEFFAGFDDGGGEEGHGCLDTCCAVEVEVCWSLELTLFAEEGGGNETVVFKVLAYTWEVIDDGNG